MRTFQWKNSYSTFNVKIPKKESGFIGLLQQKIKCAEHLFHHDLSLKPYRLYRRGKKRCQFCGVKINPPLSGE